MSTLGFILAIIAAFVWSLTNILDKYLVQKYSHEGGIRALLILSMVFPIVAAPVAYFFIEGALVLNPLPMVILLITGPLSLLWLHLYLTALFEDDVTTVMPLFQLTPLFALIFGAMVLHEIIPSTALYFGTLIVLGSLVLSYLPSTGKFKLRLALMMATASASIALINTLFKLIAMENLFWTALFWQAVAMFLTGLALYALSLGHQRDFDAFIISNWGTGLKVNTINETLTVIGDTLFFYAILLSPLALVQSIEAYQPVFVFLLGLALMHWKPALFKEDMSRAVLLQKSIGISLVVIGSILLASL